MNMQMLNAVGPGITQGQTAQANLADLIQQHQIRQKAIDDANAAERASAWLGGGGLADALGGLGTPVPGGASPAAMPGPLPSPVAAPQGGGIGGMPIQQGMAPPPAPPVSQPDASGMAYSDPSIDRLTRLLIGEAGGEDDRGQQAVAAVVHNRAKQSGMSLDDVIAAPGQFEPYSNTKRWSELQSIDTSNPAYIRARANAMRVLQGDVPDPTSGADHFYSPSSQKAFGRPAPAWDNGAGVDLGRQRFFKLGWRGDGAPQANSDGTPPDAATPEAQSAAMGHPSEPDYGQTYSPMDSLRMTMQLADFIGSRYKEVTGKELAPHLLMDQVERVAKLSNQFTGAQRLAVQQGVAGLRSSTALAVQGEKSDTSMRNTDVRTDTQRDIATGHDDTSRANTGDRVAQSDANNVRSTNTSRDNTDKRVKTSSENNIRNNDTSAANTDKRVTASRDNADTSGQARVDAARVGFNKNPSDRWDPEGAGAQTSSKPQRADPLKPAATSAANPPAAALSQLKAGVNTTFSNGQTWTIVGGKPKRLK